MQVPPLTSFGRDDKGVGVVALVGNDTVEWNYPTQANGRLEWGTRPLARRPGCAKKK